MVSPVRAAQTPTLTANANNNTTSQFIFFNSCFAASTTSTSSSSSFTQLQQQQSPFTFDSSHFGVIALRKSITAYRWSYQWTLPP